MDSKLSTVYTMISVPSVMAVTSKLYSRSSSRLVDTRTCLMERCVCTHENVSYLLMVVSQPFPKRTNFAF